MRKIMGIDNRSSIMEEETRTEYSKVNQALEDNDLIREVESIYGPFA